MDGQGPAGTSSRYGRIALKNLVGNACFSEAMRKRETTDAGANDDDARGNSHICKF